MAMPTGTPLIVIACALLAPSVSNAASRAMSIEDVVRVFIFFPFSKTSLLFPGG
jgi:hypothetical protein